MDEVGVVPAESDLEVTSLPGALVDIIYGKSVNVEAWNGDNWVSKDGDFEVPSQGLFIDEGLCL